MRRLTRRRFLQRAALAGLGSGALALGACTVQSSGLPASALLERTWNRLLNRPETGDDVVLTIDGRLQRLAMQLLGANPGALVALEIPTGAVLALASTPTFHPNGIVSNPNAPDPQAEAARVEAAMAALINDPARPLLNRALQGLYTPGSTFKTVTLFAALDRKIVEPGTIFRFQLKPPNAQQKVPWHDNRWTTCHNHPTLSQLDLTGAYAWSCNIVFSELALQMGPDVYTDYATRFGLNEALPLEVPVEPSRLTTDPNYFRGPEGTYALASTGFGQGQLQTTPLQMALVAATAVTGGVVPRPYLIQEVRKPDGTLLRRTQPQGWRQAVSAETAQIVARMMAASVENGWASAVKLPNIPLGGKTGTAELDAAATPHSWFIGFGPVNAPKIAVAVVAENAGFGSDRAAPIAKQFFQGALGG